MTGDEIRNARAALGDLWGLGRPLFANEFARALRLTGRDPGLTVLRWEKEKYPISGPVSVAVEMMLSGCKPPDWDTVVQYPAGGRPRKEHGT